MKKRKIPEGQPGWRSKANGRKRTAADKARDKKTVKQRVENIKFARERGIYGKLKSMGKDISHSEGGKLTLEDSSANRSRNGKDGSSTLRRLSSRRKKKKA